MRQYARHGRRWTAISTASLLIPTVGIAIAVQDPTTTYPTMLALALLCGLGGANFSSSMANISFFFPKERKGSALGVGPIDATFRAIANLTGTRSTLLYFAVSSITGGTDAQGEVTVRLAKDGRVVNGQGADTDIVVASVKAYINAINKLVSKPEKVNPQV